MNEHDHDGDHLKRFVSTHLEVSVSDQADIVLAIAVAEEYERVDEQLLVSVNGCNLEVERHGQLHFVKNVGRGLLLVDYRATVVGVVLPATAHFQDGFQYIRPSRYCESDRLAPLAGGV